MLLMLLFTVNNPMGKEAENFNKGRKKGKNEIKHNDIDRPDKTYY